MFPAKVLNHLHWRIVRRSLKTVGTGGCIGFGFDIRGGRYIEIGNAFYAGKNVVLEAWDIYRGMETGYTPTLRIGSNVMLSSYCHISCANRILIGDGVLFGPNVFICDNMHGNREDTEIPPVERSLEVGGAVRIGDNVWIGRNVCIMPGVSIGNGAVIGANAVVTHDVPAGSVAAGVPARVWSEKDKIKNINTEI